MIYFYIYLYVFFITAFAYPPTIKSYRGFAECLVYSLLWPVAVPARILNKLIR